MLCADLEQPILAVKRPRTTPTRPPCTASLRGALLSLFKQGLTDLSLDELMQRLAAMPKLAAGLGRRETVTKALAWLATSDDNPLLTYAAEHIHSLLG